MRAAKPKPTRRQTHSGCRGTQEQGIGPDQLSSIEGKKVDESDVDESKQPDGKQPRPEAGKPGGDEKVHAVGLDVTTEFSAARLFSRLVFLVCTACADVEGLHRVDIMHQFASETKRKTLPLMNADHGTSEKPNTFETQRKGGSGGKSPESP